MTPGSIVVRHPSAPVEQLLLLFHGVGATPHDLVPLGERLGTAFRNALVVSVAARQSSDFGRGYQWFSVTGVTDANRMDRVARAMPDFLATIAHWRKVAKVNVEATALVGFSQGAIMALESTKETPAAAGRVVALSGRFAELPTCRAPHTTIHLIHGKEDPVMPYSLTVAAAERLRSLGTDVTADVLTFVGHAIPDEMAKLVLDRLRDYLPQRRRQEAMAGNRELE